MSKIGEKMHIGIYVNAYHSRQILIKHEFFRHIFEKYSNVQFHENATVNVCRVCPSAHIKHLDYQGTNFYRQQVLLLRSVKKLKVLLKSDKNVIAIHTETLSMLIIIIFQCIATGKTEILEERFIQIDNTNFLSNASFFSPGICAV